MTKKTKFAIRLLLFFVVIYYLVTLIPLDPPDKNDIKLLLVHNPKIKDEYKYVLDVYRSVLEEEGTPFKPVSPSFLLTSEPSEVLLHHPALLFPDRISSSMPSDLRFWVKEYLSLGGHVAIIFDSGVKNLESNYLDRGLFSDLLGFNYSQYNQLEDSNDAHTVAYFRFRDKKSAEFFQVPPGKTNDKFFMVGYKYGQLTYPIARTETGKNIDEKDTYAYVETLKGETYPAIVLKKDLPGSLLYVNLPLGHLKAYSDDLWIRSVLRTFIFKIARLPHLLNTPQGKGGLVINWHIDWGEDREGLAFMKRNGFFFDRIRYSIHNTASDFTDRPGDRLGFDAAGKGRNILKSVLQYGTLGSHGGWAHNWFYTNILNGNFKEKEIETYIVKNNKLLESISGYPVTEYSAPNGVHPQPLATKILERNGVIAYYYTGDSGSAPNRTFYEKKMVSKNVIAFPLLSYRTVASFYEMDRDGMSAKSVGDWMHGVLDYVIKNRSIRLIYSHSYDVPPYYPNTIRKFFQTVNQKCKEGKVLAMPMTYFARYLQHFLETRYRFIRKSPTEVEVRVSNPNGLAGTVIAIPADTYEVPQIKGIQIEKEEGYYYLNIRGNANAKVFNIGYRNR
ncbi:MAG: hypothetical protein GY940_31530 [bacterium]|nr:hypothetical protein [bacterium]